MMKAYIKKRIVWLVLLFVVSIVVINIVGPALQKKVREEYKEQIAQTVYVSDSVSTERILCIDDNEEALLWRLRMIAAAKEFIVLATFDLRDDESGTAVMAALLNAADRGVAVKLSDGTERKGISFKARELGKMKDLVYQMLRVIIRPFRHML